eukprot:1115174-Prymnesium_polylepis.1
MALNMPYCAGASSCTRLPVGCSACVLLTAALWLLTRLPSPAPTRDTPPPCLSADGATFA